MISNVRRSGKQLYSINDLYLAVQGEGTLTGVPMLIIRLQGCPVGCVFCDTKETWHRDNSSRVDTIASQSGLEWRGRNHRWTQIGSESIAALARLEAGKNVSWILLTGGEPAEQNLSELVASLHDAGFKVALETSGTADGMVGAELDWICISPKIDNPGGRPISRSALRLANEMKFVIGSERDVIAMQDFCDEFRDVIGALLPEGEHPEFCVQPMSQNQKATELCLSLAKSEGLRLSIQIHKYVVADGADRFGAPLSESPRGGLVSPKHSGMSQ